MSVAALKFTHTHTLLYYTQNTNTSCIWSLCFLFPRCGCRPYGNDALTNKSITSMNVGMQHIAIKAPSEMHNVGSLYSLIIHEYDVHLQLHNQVPIKWKSVFQV
ncbi:hypothetical protein ATANTOWER_020591 [Ataeniobius toweri]|uniref:Uncharacterized protein n=1 Tax=Ataeniobius toweri TaxID=208326 RepID=A0ABU7BEG2_9TELE|nr:hypothetical protein [Ataeniobius toweri]